MLIILERHNIFMGKRQSASKMNIIANMLARVVQYLVIAIPHSARACFIHVITNLAREQQMPVTKVASWWLLWNYQKTI